MKVMDQINDWSIKHHPKWLVVIRAALGLALFLKGVEFIQNNTALEQIISHTSMSQSASWLASFIPWAHLFGGCMILIGLFTRLACLSQIPILIGAVFFVNAKQGFYHGGSDLVISVLILLLLLFFFVEGGGSYSLDNYFGRTAKQ